jgi:hypothetical protein
MSDASTGPDEVRADATPAETKDEQMTDSTLEVEPAVEPAAEPAVEPTLGWPVTAPEPVAAPEPAARRGPSVPTVIWGLLFALVAAGVIAAQTSDVDLNLDVTAPTALLVAGVVLVLWGIAGLGRSRLRR